MTQPAEPTPAFPQTGHTITQAAGPPPPPVIAPAPDSRLEQLSAQYTALKPEADRIAAALKAVTDGIKAELVAAAPGHENIVLRSPCLVAPLRLSAVESWRFDSKRCKAEDPEVYVRFAKKSISWRLESAA